MLHRPSSRLSRRSNHGDTVVTGSTRTESRIIAEDDSGHDRHFPFQIRQGRVEGNKMVNAKLINHKLIDRACRIFMERNPEYTDYESEAADSRKQEA